MTLASELIPFLPLEGMEDYQDTVYYNPIVPEEQWKFIKDTNEMYEASDLGRIRSWWNNRHGRAKTPKILKKYLDTRGYHKVSMKINGKMVTIRVHRLVAETWLPNPENKRTVNHINGKDKTNNHISNLEWATDSENTKHAYDTGLIKQKIGKESKSLKYGLVVLKDGIEVAVLYGAKEYANFGLNRGNVHSVLTEKRSHYKGYTFEKRYL
jgi:hypothetical protein